MKYVFDIMQKIYMDEIMRWMRSVQTDILLKTTDDNRSKHHIRTQIPKALREAVFTKYCLSYDNAKCYIGCGERISPFNFECGHVISQKDGGKSTMENLRPICGRCNNSMGTRNMYEFIESCGFKTTDTSQISSHETHIIRPAITSNITPTIEHSIIHTGTRANSCHMTHSVDSSVKYPIESPVTCPSESPIDSSVAYPSESPIDSSVTCSSKSQINSSVACPSESHVIQPDVHHTSHIDNDYHLVSCKSHICPMCGETLSTKQCLEYHIQHGVCCKTNRTCPTCGKIFTNNRNYRAHIDNGICSKRQSSKKLESIAKQSSEELSKNELISKLQTEVTQYKSKCETLLDGSTVDIQQNATFNVFPHEFGKEDLSRVQAIAGDFLGNLLKYTEPTDSIPKLFAQIHKNESLPEFHNVFTTCERSNYALISDGKNFNEGQK